MVKRVSNASQSSLSRIGSASVIEYNHQQQQAKPFSKPSPIVFLIIMVIIGFMGNVGYETYEEFTLNSEKQAKQRKTCLMDFGKLNCNVASPSQHCTPVVDCIINKKQNPTLILEIILKEVEENFMVPSIMVGLLLIYRLCQILTETKQKNE